MDIATAYERTWGFSPPRTCREMHAAGLFDPRSPAALRLAVFEVYDAVTIAKGDAFVRDCLIPGLVPVGGDRSGDRWCFDTRRRIGGTIPVLACPHDGGGATYVAPSFAAFVYTRVLEGVLQAHRSADDRNGVRRLTLEHLDRLDRWLLRRWVRRAKAMLDGEWPTHRTFDAWLREDPSFAWLPTDELEHVLPAHP